VIWRARHIKQAAAMLPGERVVGVVPIEQDSANERLWRLVPIVVAIFLGVRAH
jgi:hypothetical protein